MSNDLQTRDKQNQEVDSSEQYAINTIGDKALQSADYVVKESKRALEKAMGKRTIAPKSSDSRVSTSKRAYQPVSAQQNAERQKAHAPEYVSPSQSGEYAAAWVRPVTQYEEEKQEPVAYTDTVHNSDPTPTQKQNGNAVKRTASRKSETRYIPACWNRAGWQHPAMGDALLQKKFTTDTLPFRKKKNRGEKPQYYVENSNPPIVSKETYMAAQELQKSRHISHKCEGGYPLTGILRCPECDRSFRRLLLNGTAYWLCSGKAAGATDCKSRRVRENAVYDTFCLMVDKLSAHHNDLLGTLINQLEMMQNRGGECQEKVRQIDKLIADLSAQNLVVARLHTNGVLNATDFAAQSSVISNKINALRLDRKKALAEDEDDELIYTLKLLDDTLAGYVPGTSFSQALFEQIVQSITVVDNARLAFYLIGGLTLTECIPENVGCRTA